MPDATAPKGSIIVQCGECKTKFRFRLPEKAATGIRLRCGVCGTVFAFAPPERRPPKMIDISLLKGNGEDKEQGAVPPFGDFRPARRSGLRRGLLFVLLTAAILAGAGFIWMNPSMVPIAAIRDLPPLPAVMEKLGLKDRMGLLVESRPDRDVDPVEKVQIGAVQQRFVLNSKMGNLRIIEGTVTNESAAPLTRIRMMGKLYDDQSTLLAVQTASCGRILSDEELAGISEQDLLAARDGSGGADPSPGSESARPSGKTDPVHDRLRRRACRRHPCLRHGNLGPDGPVMCLDQTPGLRIPACSEACSRTHP